MRRNLFYLRASNKALVYVAILIPYFSLADAPFARTESHQLPTGEEAASRGTDLQGKLPAANTATQIKLEEEVLGPQGAAIWREGGQGMAKGASLSSSFGWRRDPLGHGYRMHEGIDIRSDHGAPAKATAAGIVTFAGWAGGYGNMVEIAHGGGVVTRYAHLSRIDVARSAAIVAGQLVGQVGSTGRSTGSHLHYEVRVGGKAIDPLSDRIAFVRQHQVTIPSPWVSAEATPVPERQEWSDPQSDGMLPHVRIK